MQRVASVQETIDNVVGGNARGYEQYVRAAVDALVRREATQVANLAELGAAQGLSAAQTADACRQAGLGTGGGGYAAPADTAPRAAQAEGGLARIVREGARQLRALADQAEAALR